MAEQNAIQTVLFTAGSIVCNEGDAGGDLLIIERGQVEVIGPHGGKSNALMNAGDIIGLTSSFNNEPRPSTVRAVTDVTLKIVPQDQLMATLQKIPAWLKLTIQLSNEKLKKLSDANVKLQQMNLAIKNSGLNAMDSLSLYANFAATLAPSMIKNVNSTPCVNVEQLIQAVSQLLSSVTPLHDKIGALMCEQGIIRQETIPPSTDMVLKPESFEKITWFARFMHDIKSGAKRKILEADFTHKEQKLFQALIKYSNKQHSNPHHMFTVEESDLQANLKKVTGEDFQVENLRQAIRFGLISRNADLMKITVQFIPSILGRTIASLTLIRRTLQKREELLNPDKAKKKSAA